VWCGHPLSQHRDSQDACDVAGCECVARTEPEGDAVRDGGSSPDMPISECVAEPRESWRLPHQPNQR
jgi:hypothetical protein